MQVNAVRNPEGIWINSSVFQEEALHFEKYKYYCADRKGSPAWVDYWTEQLRRCREGHTVGGVRITGHHYFYLNFTEIQVVEEISETTAIKKMKKPDFWDGDYNYYHSLDIARYGISKPDLLKLNLTTNPHDDYLDGGYNMIVGKARRKGYSYKNGAICANTYNSERNALTIIGAFDKKYLYPTGTMAMANSYINLLNERTGWTKARQYIDRIEHRRASYKEISNGVEIERGYMSEIMAVTFQNNPDAARGKDARYVLLEEAGVFPNLIDSYNATAPGLKAGKYATGQIIIFGTGGDMEGGTQDFAQMFYDPKGFGLMPFENIWDENADKTVCGFFHPCYWNFEGFYDKQGNSDEATAKQWELDKRKEIIKGASGNKLVQQRVQEFPTCPAEAFLTVSFNDFPVIELRRQLNKLKTEKLHLKKGQPVHLYKNELGKVEAKPDLRNELEILWDYRPKTTNLHGGVVIYEAPIDNAPWGLYKIGYDPYRQDQGSSLSSIIVYKGVAKHNFTHDIVVAEYIGRPNQPDDVNKIASLLALYYNTQVMHENEVTHVKTWFIKSRLEHLLAEQADKVISANIIDSKVARIYGMHMVEKLKDAGEKYLKTWLMMEMGRDEHGRMLTTIDFLYSPGIIEELLAYNRKHGNFDRVMALMQVMFQVEEEELGHQYETVVDKNIADMKTEVDSFFAGLYNKNISGYSSLVN